MADKPQQNEAYWIERNYPEGQWWKRSIFILLCQLAAARFGTQGREEARLHKAQRQ